MKRKEHPSNRNIQTAEDIKDLVYWHRPSQDQVQRMEAIAKQTEELMSAIVVLCPDCLDRYTAIRKLREVRMWANCAIALEPPSEIDHNRCAGEGLTYTPNTLSYNRLADQNE